MNRRILLFSIVMTSLSTTCFADDKAYIGMGLSYLDLDGANSVNLPITLGYNIHRWKFSSTKIQALSLGIEGQYSDSISGTDNVANYSIFAVAKAYTSEQWYFKVKQGFTDFSDLPLTNADAENSHIGLGIGIGYQLRSASFELEYVYPNKTIHASSIEISYKFHF